MTDNLNKRLKARIIELYGSQSIFARVMGIRDARISRIINGFDSLNCEEQKRWSVALNCSPKIFRGGPVGVNNEW